MWQLSGARWEFDLARSTSSFVFCSGTQMAAQCDHDVHPSVLLLLSQFMYRTSVVKVPFLTSVGRTIRTQARLCRNPFLIVLLDASLSAPASYTVTPS